MKPFNQSYYIYTQKNDEEEGMRKKAKGFQFRCEKGIKLNCICI